MNEHSGLTFTCFSGALLTISIYFLFFYLNYRLSRLQRTLRQALLGHESNPLYSLPRPLQFTLVFAFAGSLTYGVFRLTSVVNPERVLRDATIAALAGFVLIAVTPITKFFKNLELQNQIRQKLKYHSVFCAFALLVGLLVDYNSLNIVTETAVVGQVIHVGRYQSNLFKKILRYEEKSMRNVRLQVSSPIELMLKETLILRGRLDDEEIIQARKKGLPMALQKGLLGYYSPRGLRSATYLGF